MDYAYPKTWDDQEKLFGQWARTLRKELDCADPWGEMERYRLAFDGETATTTVNEPIPAIEAEEIVQSELQRFIRLRPIQRLADKRGSRILGISLPRRSDEDAESRELERLEEPPGTA
jgi:hypothetical protein